MALVGFWGFDENPTELGTGAVATSATAGTGRILPGRSVQKGTSTLSDLVTFTAQTSIFFGVAVNWPGSFGANAFLAFLDSGGNIHLRLRTTAAGGLELYGPANTLVASAASPPFSANIWQSVQGAITISDTVGTVEIKVEGTVVLTYSGDTRNAGTGNIATIQCGAPAGTVGFDDMWVTNPTGAAPYNTYLGDCVVRHITPSGNGDSSGWTGSDGNSVDNYALVDETSVNSTDYVAASTAGLTDLYQMDNVPTTDLVYAYRVNTYAAKSDAGTPPVLKPVSKGALGTVREETALALATTFQYFGSANNTTDPDGNALTAARINALQAGVRSA